MPDIPVAIYCRTAMEDPMEPSHLDAQEMRCREYCEKHGLTVGLVHRDVGSGLEYLERPGLRHLRMRYRQGEVNGVVFTHTDRLSRNQVHVAILIKEMEKYGIAIHTVEDSVYGSPGGMLLHLMRTFTKEMEAEKRKDDLLDE